MLDSPSCDPELASVIESRLEYGVLNWIQTAIPDKVLRPEIDHCCGRPCHRIAAKRSGYRSSVSILNLTLVLYFKWVLSKHYH